MGRGLFCYTSRHTLAITKKVASVHKLSGQINLHTEEY